MTLALPLVPAFATSGSGESVSLAVAMLMIFGSAKVLAEIFERLRQPGIIGEILAGILIGPSVLSWISPSWRAGFAWARESSPWRWWSCSAWRRFR